MTAVTDTPTALSGLTDDQLYLVQNQSGGNRRVLIKVADSVPDAGDSGEILVYGERWWGSQESGEGIYVWTLESAGGSVFVAESE